jgi:hypothetical protein
MGYRSNDVETTSVNVVPYVKVGKEIIPPEVLVELNQLVGIGSLGGSDKDSKLVGTILHDFTAFVHVLHGGHLLKKFDPIRE